MASIVVDFCKARYDLKTTEEEMKDVLTETADAKRVNTDMLLNAMKSNNLECFLLPPGPDGDVK